MKVLLPFPGARDAPTTFRLRRWVVLGAPLLIAACASQPIAEIKSGAPTAQRLANSDLDIVCLDTTVTGSRFPERVCQTRKEWGSFFPVPFGGNGSGPSADVGVQPWAPGMPVPTSPMR